MVVRAGEPTPLKYFQILRAQILFFLLLVNLFCDGESSMCQKMGRELIKIVGRLVMVVFRPMGSAMMAKHGYVCSN